jgi:hypothetical protein
MQTAWPQNRKSGFQGKSQQYLNPALSYAVLTPMADEKKGSKDIVLWIITVALVALAIFLYKR